MKKILIIFLCAFVTLGLCSCNKTKQGAKKTNNTTTSTKNNQSTKSTTTVDPDSIGDKVYTELEEYKNGTHIFNVSDTDKDFIQNGLTEYVILTSSKPSTSIIEASAYFFDLYFEATGNSISTVDDTQVEYSEDAKVISIGANLYQEAALVNVPDVVNSNGYVIKTVGNSIFVLGKTDIGSLFGTYELLTQLFNYMIYATDTYRIDKDVKNLKLKNFDIVDSPDFEERLAAWGNVYYDASKAHSLRFQLQYDEIYMNSSRAFHNTLELIDVKNHPEWVASNQKQLCYTAHGNSDDYEAMVDAMFEAVKAIIIKEPKKHIITITQEDNGSWCGCDTCKALFDAYGTDAVSQNIFINDVADKVQEWLDAEYPERDVLIATFAYYKTEKPPVIKNDDGTYSPIDENCILHDNVAILYAGLGTLGYNHSIDDEVNSSVREILDGWKVCSSNFGVWNYQTHFNDYFMPYDTFTASKEQYIKYLNMNCKWIFDQGQHNNRNSSNFNSLKLFLNSQWEWDVNRDYNDLVDDFFENFYGKKDGALRQYYEELRTHLAMLDAKGLVGVRCSENGKNSDLWPLQLLRQWMTYIDKAYEEIEGYKESDPELYQKFYDHITLESLTIRYMLIEFYIGYFPKDEQVAMKSSFKNDCLHLDVSQSRENGTISDYTKGW